MVLKEFFAEARRRRQEGQEHQKGSAAPSVIEAASIFDGP